MNATCCLYSLPVTTSRTRCPVLPLIVSNEKNPSRRFGIFSLPNMSANRPPAPLWPDRITPPAAGAAPPGH